MRVTIFIVFICTRTTHSLNCERRVALVVPRNAARRAVSEPRRVCAARCVACARDARDTRPRGRHWDVVTSAAAYKTHRSRADVPPPARTTTGAPSYAIIDSRVCQIARCNDVLRVFSLRIGRCVVVPGRACELFVAVATGGSDASNVRRSVSDPSIAAQIRASCTVRVRVDSALLLRLSSAFRSRMCAALRCSRVWRCARMCCATCVLLRISVATRAMTTKTLSIGFSFFV